jgi:hypothetical protein
MPQLKVARLAGPAYLASTATNVYNPASSTYAVVRSIAIANTTAGAVTYTLYIGATGGSTGGTEIAKGVSVPANTTVYLYPQSLRLDSSDFLVGLASSGSALTITVSGELGVSG